MSTLRTGITQSLTRQVTNFKVGVHLFCHDNQMRPIRPHVHRTASFNFLELKQLGREGNYCPSSRAKIQISWILSFLYLKLKLQKFISGLFSYEMLSPIPFISEEAFQLRKINELHIRTNEWKIWMRRQTERGCFCMVLKPLKSERESESEREADRQRSSCNSQYNCH
jgi:hypothetical protein